MTKTRAEQWAALAPWSSRMLWFAAGMWFPSILGWAFAAESLPAVSPPTDWTGVAVVAAIGILAVAVTGYILYLKRPGMQLGEEQIERIANALHRKSMATVTLNIPPAAPLTFDGKTFASEEKLAEYKVAKAIIDGYSMEKAP